MADTSTPPYGSPKNGSENADIKEDSATAAARRELKQSSISGPSAKADDDEASNTAAPTTDDDKKDKESAEEQVLSPKKKRAHDQLDGDKPTDGDEDTQKKRPRDAESADKESVNNNPAISRRFDVHDTHLTNDLKPAEEKEEKPQTSSSAFGASAFGKLATASSPFAFLGASSASGFGSSGASKLSSFASPTKTMDAKPSEPPKFQFGGGVSVSPFATLASGGSNGFGSAFGGSGFGAASTGVKPLGSFAAPTAEPLTSEKPAKPFGAPDSDVESDDEDDEDDESSQPEEETSSPVEKELDDKKKPKLQKVTVDSGESGEATILAVRAKVFYHDKEAGWKERGSGMLKINAPEACVDFDDAGTPIPGSFDASGLDVNDEEAQGSKGHKMVRLILRQDQTHRVILNTAVYAATKFQEKTSLKSVGIVFTAFEGKDAKAVNITAKTEASQEHGGEMTARVFKRKRTSQRAELRADSSISEGDSTAGYGGISTQSRRKKTTKTENAPGQRKGKKGEAPPVDALIPWTPRLKSLEKTHRALNLVYTFCCTRKHLATTFEMIRPAVESHIRTTLTVEEVASVVALRPDGINFLYVDELTLELEGRGAEKDEAFRTGSSGKGQSRPHDASVGGLTGRDSLEKCHGRQNGSAGSEVLYFEFVDGDLKRQVQDRKTGEPVKPNRRLREETLKMPVYSQKQMAQLIERRNQKFTNAVNIFLNTCAKEGLDPNITLAERTKAHIPTPTIVEDDTLWAPDTIPEEIPKERKSIADIIQELKDSPWYTGQIVPDGHRVFEPQEPVYGDLDFLLSQDLVNALYNAKGITQFYAHQAEALNGIHNDQNVVVSTPTSSGKSLIYQLPILHALEHDRLSRAMYIFPTKALAQDQKRSLKELMSYIPGMEETLVETLDGDTPMNERNDIRELARVIFTNPDMLHITILPQEEKWRSFLANLKFVVVANPEEHFKTIFGVDDARLIDYDGSPTGRKEFLCWNTPFKDPGDPASGRGNAKFECARLFCSLILRGVRIIAFCRVRKQCEELVNAIKQELEDLGRPECAKLVMGYRGGYTPQDRRRVESEMFQGKLLGIVATTALELGIDIGSLDCVMTWGFPYTIANLRQQSGRAGRRNKDSLSILVGDSFPADQHYMQNPDELFTKPNAELQVDLENLLVREGHIQCAAYEMPLQPADDANYFGQDLQKICEERLILDETGFYHCHDRFRPAPSRFVAIRDVEEDHFAIIDVTNGRNVVLEELEASRATFTIYDGAIFLHQGNKYLVRDFLPDRLMAKVERVKVDWTTMQRDFTDVDPVETEAIRKLSNSRSLAYYGTIKVQQTVFGFFKVDKWGRILDAVQVDNPPVVRYSKGMWLDVPKTALEILASRRLHMAAAIHAAEHAIISLLPTFVVSMLGDVRTECKSAIKEFGKKETSRKRPARLTFYDTKGGAGGSGINTKAFDHLDALLRDALDRVEKCGCHRGCVECVTLELCQESNEVISKAGCRVVLRSVLGMDIDVDGLPMGPEDHSPVGVETIVAAQPVMTRMTAQIKKEEEEDYQGLSSL
ncbi:DEAD/DEAH box helicase domain-containing protein [Geosmithia morbida]|uniref:DEAD/DEAH box helicase domain-containing protein n=1 Tax=Geosmithia morbida TaxID=1094350 RepID=A0A9P5D666_9HYPO|nr:DEAD/DEAH box helicase domain-containing protein [Geosmithia morbida]KAF4125296.1 DEAD/DEAH box helicase domain-containing protein [Geosmithia morbida]